MHHQYTGAPISSTTPFTTPVPLSEPCVSSSSSSYLTMTESVSPMVGVTVTPAVRERLSLSSKFMKRCLSPAMHRRCDMRFLESEEEENEKKDKEDVIQLSPSPPTKSLKSSRHSPKESHGRQQKKNYTLTIPPLSLDELDESVEPTISRFASSRLARSFKSSNSKRHLLLLGQERSHATGQSHGQSQTTQSDEPTNCPKPTKTQVGLMTKQSTNPPNVHTVMTPMPQPVGSWHVTSMTGQMNSTMSHNKLHDQTHKTID